VDDRQRPIVPDGLERLEPGIEAEEAVEVDG